MPEPGIIFGLLPAVIPGLALIILPGSIWLTSNTDPGQGMAACQQGDCATALREWQPSVSMPSKEALIEFKQNPAATT